MRKALFALLIVSFIGCSGPQVQPVPKVLDQDPVKPEQTVEPADDPVKLVQQKPTGPHRDPVKPAKEVPLPPKPPAKEDKEVPSSPKPPVKEDKEVPPAPKTLLDAVKGGTFNQIKQFVDGGADTGRVGGYAPTHYLGGNEKLSIKEMGEAWILLGGGEEGKEIFLEIVKGRRGDGDDSSVPALKTLFDAARYGTLNQIKQFVEDGADIEAYLRGFQPVDYLVGNLVLSMKEMGEAYILLGGKEAGKDNFLENVKLERELEIIDEA